MTTPTRPRSRMPLAAWIFAVAVPIVVGLAGIALQLVWLPVVPDPLAIHWNGADEPDGFAPPVGIVVLSALMAVGLPTLFGVVLATSRGPAPTATHKLLVATSALVSTLVTVALTASVGIQRGLDDARDAGGITGWLLAGLAAGVVLAAIAWFALPRAVAADPHATTVQPLELAPGERGAWITSTRPTIGIVAVILGAVVVVVAASVLAIAVAGATAWPVAIAPIALLVAAATSLAWRVRVDGAGLTVRSMPFGWPAVVIPVSDIARVETVAVEPLSEFGGYGWRWAPGRSFGVIARRGEAIEVERHDGRRFTVTVDDAARGAALLAAYASR